MFWILLWKFVLILTLVTYSLLTIVVSIGGVFDVRSMIDDLKSSSKPEN